jgi:hypothetical protein
MKKYIILVLALLVFVNCKRYVDTEPLPERDSYPVQSQPINIEIFIEGDQINNFNNNVAEVDLDSDFDFNIYLEGGEDYFERVKRDPTQVPNRCEDPKPGRHLLCHVYDFNGRTQLATQLNSAPHLGSFYMDTFDVTPRDWQQGFPKFPASLSHLRENYAIRCFTKLRVTRAGQHIFSIISDDGMRVLLNNSPVVEDDGVHPPRTTSAATNLTPGLYNMEIQWFQGPRTQIAAELKWATPNDTTLRYITSKDTQKAKKLCKIKK